MEKVKISIKTLKIVIFILWFSNLLMKLYSKSSNSVVFKQCEFTITRLTFWSQNIRSSKENSTIPRNSANFDPHPSIDSNSAVSNSVMYFLDKNACYLRTCCTSNIERVLPCRSSPSQVQTAHAALNRHSVMYRCTKLLPYF